MRLPVVSRRHHELAVLQLENRILGLQASLAAAKSIAPKARRWPAFLAGVWLLVIGILAGGMAIPHAQDGPVLQDTAGCIAQARYEHPITGNQYQELVNALYSCGVYGENT